MMRPGLGLALAALVMLQPGCVVITAASVVGSAAVAVGSAAVSVGAAAVGVAADATVGTVKLIGKAVSPSDDKAGKDAKDAKDKKAGDASHGDPKPAAEKGSSTDPGEATQGGNKAGTADAPAPASGAR